MALWRRLLVWLRHQFAEYQAVLCMLGLRTCKACRGARLAEVEALRHGQVANSRVAEGLRPDPSRGELN